MNTLYLLGGPPRTAKTAIMTGVMAKGNIPFIPADAIEHGMRNVLTGLPHQMLRQIEFSGSAEHKFTVAGGGVKKSFSGEGSESEFTLTAILGVADYYARANSSVAFEGTAITPQWVSNLDLASFTIRAAFVGYTHISHADAVISYAKSNPHDWINEWIKNDRGDETAIREWLEKQVEGCLSLRVQAEKYSYPFFDISTMAYEEFVASVQQYFLDI